MTLGATEFLLDLVNAGVEVLDLTPQFVAERSGEEGDELFLDYNLHWSPRGAELAARLLAERLHAYGWFEPGPYVEGKDFAVVVKTVECRKDGSRAPPGFRRQRVTTNVLTTAAVGMIPRSVDAKSPIVLLGDSFPGFLESGCCCRRTWCRVRIG